LPPKNGIGSESSMEMRPAKNGGGGRQFTPVASRTPESPNTGELRARHAAGPRPSVGDEARQPMLGLNTSV
jgi:hypothetical protein